MRDTSRVGVPSVWRGRLLGIAVVIRADGVIVGTGTVYTARANSRADAHQLVIPNITDLEVEVGAVVATEATV